MNDLTSTSMCSSSSSSDVENVSVYLRGLKGDPGVVKNGCTSLHPSGSDPWGMTESSDTGEYVGELCCKYRGETAAVIFDT